MYLASNLKYLRNKMGLSLAQLGYILQKSRSLMFKWENAEREPSIEDLIKLSKLYKVSIDTLIKKDISKGD